MNDGPSLLYARLSAFVPLVGLGLYLFTKHEAPQRARSALQGFWVGSSIYTFLILGVFVLATYNDEVARGYYYSALRAYYGIKEPKPTSPPPAPSQDSDQTWAVIDPNNKADLEIAVRDNLNEYFRNRGARTRCLSVTLTKQSSNSYTGEALSRNGKSYPISVKITPEYNAKGEYEPVMEVEVL